MSITDDKLTTSDAPKRCERFYMENVVFKVEDTLFKVPKTYFVENSTLFEAMFSLPQTDGVNPDGSSDENPLLLEDVTARDFERLLGYIYPRPSHTKPPNVPGANATLFPDNQVVSTPEEILPLIKLTRRWMLRGMHSTLVSRYEKRNPNATGDHWVAIGKEHGMPSWIRRGYVDLFTNPTSISVAQVQQIGIEDAVRLFHLRERYTRVSYSRAFAESEINASFKDFLEAVQNDYHRFYLDSL